MNIIGLYAFRTGQERVWCTPNSILNELERRGHHVTRVSLFDENAQYSDTNLRRLAEAKATPDMILFFDYGRFDSEWLDKKYFPSSFFVGEMGDTPQNFDRSFHQSNRFNLIHTPDYNSSVRYKVAGRNVLHLPHWADTSLRKVEYFADTAHPVRSTRGRGSSPILDALSDIMPDKFMNVNGWTGEEHHTFLSGGLITVQHSRFGEWTRRIPEAMLAGSLVLTDKLPPYTRIENSFVHGEDIVYYTSLSDCISKINYYLSEEGEEERMRIAGNGQRKVIEGHAQVQRVDAILEEYDKWRYWNKALFPVVEGVGGKAIVTSIPKGDNYYYDLYMNQNKED